MCTLSSEFIRRTDGSQSLFDILGSPAILRLLIYDSLLSAIIEEMHILCDHIEGLLSGDGVQLDF